MPGPTLEDYDNLPADQNDFEHEVDSDDGDAVADQADVQNSFPDEEIEIPGKWFLGVQAKQGITRWNLLAVPALQFVVMLIAGTYSTLLTKLLEDKKYYGLSMKNVIDWEQASGNFGTIPGMVILFCAGFTFDIFGRKWTIAISFLFGGVSIFLYVLCAPSYSGYLIADLLFGFSLGPLGDSPLVMDYAMKDSTAKLLSWRLIGVCAGSILSTDGLLTLTQNMDPLYSFGIMGLIFIGFGILTFFIVQDPPQARIIENQKIGKKICDLLINLKNTVIKMPYLIIGWILLIFVQGPMIILEMYLFIWLQTFEHPKDEPNFVMHYYQIQGTVGPIATVIVLYFFGYLVDKFPPKLTISAAFAFRAVIMLAIYTIKDPINQFGLYVTLVPMTHVTLYIAQVAISNYLFRLYPYKVRGIMVMSSHFLGIALGPIYSNTVTHYSDMNPKNCYLCVAVADSIGMVITLVCFTFRILKDPGVKKQEENAFESILSEGPKTQSEKSKYKLLPAHQQQQVLNPEELSTAGQTEVERPWEQPSQAQVSE